MRTATYRGMRVIVLCVDRVHAWIQAPSGNIFRVARAELKGEKR